MRCMCHLTQMKFQKKKMQMLYFMKSCVGCFHLEKKFHAKLNCIERMGDYLKEKQMLIIQQIPMGNDVHFMLWPLMGSEYQGRWPSLLVNLFLMMKDGKTVALDPPSPLLRLVHPWPATTFHIQKRCIQYFPHPIFITHQILISQCAGLLLHRQEHVQFQQETHPTLMVKILYHPHLR